jgi:hypothetical protein
MPTYDFKCRKCGQIDENIVMPITHQKEDLPWHCGQRMSYHISSPPLVHWVDPVIEPFRAIATKDKPVITTAKQNREYMERNGLVDANEVVGKPPTHLDQEETHKEVLESIAAIGPTEGLRDTMDKQGLLDPTTD